MCNHEFIVSSWKISKHTHLAQEVMCVKCMLMFDFEDIQAHRAKMPEIKKKLLALEIQELEQQINV